MTLQRLKKLYTLFHLFFAAVNKQNIFQKKNAWNTFINLCKNACRQAVKLHEQNNEYKNVWTTVSKHILLEDMTWVKVL